jgi:AcrR family transcriptional regulator
MDEGGQRDRICAAAYECVARFGMGKTTIDDVAKESGVSRATIYRLFPGGKEQLLRETVGWEMNRFFADLADRVVTAPDFASLVEEALVFAHRALREHEVLQKVLVTEPDRLLPLMTVESQRVVTAIANFVHPFLVQEAAAGRLRSGVDIDRASDWVARMTLSLIASPGSADLDDAEQVRRLVRARLLGGVLETSDGV